MSDRIGPARLASRARASATAGTGSASAATGAAPSWRRTSTAGTARSSPRRPAASSTGPPPRATWPSGPSGWPVRRPRATSRRGRRRERPRSRSGVLIFRLGDEWLAFRTRAVAEVTTPRPVHRIPHRSNDDPRRPGQPPGPVAALRLAARPARASSPSPDAGPADAGGTRDAPAGRHPRRERRRPGSSRPTRSLGVQRVARGPAAERPLDPGQPGRQLQPGGLRLGGPERRLPRRAAGLRRAAEHRANERRPERLLADGPVPHGGGGARPRSSRRACWRWRARARLGRGDRAADAGGALAQGGGADRRPRRRRSGSPTRWRTASSPPRRASSRSARRTSTSLLRGRRPAGADRAGSPRPSSTAWQADARRGGRRAGRRPRRRPGGRASRRPSRRPTPAAEPPPGPSRRRSPPPSPPPTRPPTAAAAGRRGRARRSRRPSPSRRRRGAGRPGGAGDGGEPDAADGPGGRVAGPDAPAPAVRRLAARASRGGRPGCWRRSSAWRTGSSERDGGATGRRARAAGQGQGAGRASACEGLGETVEAIEDFARGSEDLSGRLHHEVLASRMRPLADGVRGFPRLVRDVARQLGKQVEFEVVGETTGVDRDILDKLEAPLNHLIRNALDHAHRAARGAPRPPASTRPARSGWRPATARGCSRSPWATTAGGSTSSGSAPRSSSAGWPPRRWPAG